MLDVDTVFRINPGIISPTSPNVLGTVRVRETSSTDRLNGSNVSVLFTNVSGGRGDKLIRWSRPIVSLRGFPVDRYFSNVHQRIQVFSGVGFNLSSAGSSSPVVGIYSSRLGDSIAGRGYRKRTRISFSLRKVEILGRNRNFAIPTSSVCLRCVPAKYLYMLARSHSGTLSSPDSRGRAPRTS
jgi:hypothetical protein